MEKRNGEIESPCLTPEVHKYIYHLNHGKYVHNRRLARNIHAMLDQGCHIWTKSGQTGNKCDKSGTLFLDQYKVSNLSRLVPSDLLFGQI